MFSCTLEVGFFPLLFVLLFGPSPSCKWPPSRLSSMDNLGPIIRSTIPRV